MSGLSHLSQVGEAGAEYVVPVRGGRLDEHEFELAITADGVGIVENTIANAMRMDSRRFFMIIDTRFLV
jgi:hypothetical protein